MKRYDEIENSVFQFLEKNCFGIQKKDACRHLLGVSTLCLQLSRKFDLDPELCAIMGLLHDISIYTRRSRLAHAFVSSEMAKEILTSSQLFSDEETALIITAIFNHSSKHKKDDAYSELLKLCDVLERYLHEPDIALEPCRQQYLLLAKEKKII